MCQSGLRAEAAVCAGREKRGTETGIFQIVLCGEFGLGFPFFESSDYIKQESLLYKILNYMQQEAFLVPLEYKTSSR